MNPEDLHKLLNESSLIPKEKQKAWTLFHKENSEAAVRYIQHVEMESRLYRENIRLKGEPVSYEVWGEEYIEDGATSQMRNAARLPIAIAGALMPDAHQGYGLPIGGVLATENAVIPYAVGVDIACRMMMTIYPVSPDILRKKTSPEYLHLRSALVNNTLFGSGEAGMHSGKIEHPILDSSHWLFSSLARSLRDTAVRQIGTSGGGNHFVEWGELDITDDNNPLNLATGRYLALLSHSGSRGVGYKIANHFTELAMSLLNELDPTVKHLAWLMLDHESGNEYWNCMQLAGQFASACHHVIHDRVGKAAGLTPVASIENNHNFAWRETVIVNGKEKEAIVHRKGATPAGKGVLGIIPGTMADFGYVVVGKGNELSLNSASHGSGRQMTRTKAKKTISLKEHQKYLTERGIDLIGGDLDEAPQAYKPIEKVMEAQADLVSVIGKFQPKIVRMAPRE